MREKSSRLSLEICAQASGGRRVDWVFGVCSVCLPPSCLLPSELSSARTEKASVPLTGGWSPQDFSISSEAQQLLPLSVVTGDEGVEELKEGRGDWHRSHGMKDLNYSVTARLRGREGCLPEVTQLCVGEPRL